MIYRFGAVTVDDEARTVHVDGEHRPTEPQVIAVLVHLIEQRHRVVPRDELLEAVWGTPYIGASAVTSRIKSARQAIGDTGRDQTMIRTVHGRGYRFVAEPDETHRLSEHTAEPDETHRLSEHTAEPDETHRLSEHTAEPPLATQPPGSLPTAPPRELDVGWPLVGRNRELDHAVAALAGDRGGLLLTGPAGLGKTRLARAIIEVAEQRGLPGARIHGNPGMASVPLGAVAHLLPAEIAEVSGVRGDMARTVLLQRARAAIVEFAGGRRLVLLVDDVDRLDPLSQTLVASLIGDRSVFAVITQRTSGEESSAVDHLVRSGDVDHVVLGPVPDDQMIALTSRVLDGPVQPRTSESLVAASAGLPGVLRQLIEAGLANGTLAARGGVWQLTGGVTPPGDMAAAVGRRLDVLDDDQRDALELLAIAGDLDLDMAFALVDEEVLDRLELDGMISVRDMGSATRLRLAHPLFTEILLDGLTPLRDRRHRSRLAEHLASHPALSAADRLQLVRLQLDGGHEIESSLLVESAVLALVEHDTTLALRLLRMVPEADRTGRHQQLFGEVLYMRGRFDEAYRVWSSLDLDRLDDETASGVLRRLATWGFYGAWRFQEALDDLETGMERFGGAQRMLLESYWCELAALDGRRAEDVVERSARLAPAATGHARSDFLSAAAMAHFARGRYDRSLDLVAECRRETEYADRTIHWVDSAYVDFVEVMDHVELGDVEAGWATFHRVTEPGTAPDFGFAATAAGRLALVSGRWQQALDWLEPKIEITEALGIATNGRPLQAQAAVCAVMLGELDKAAEMAALMRSDLPDHVNVTTLDIRWSIARVDAAVGERGRAVDELTAAAADARALGLTYIESVLLAALCHACAADRAVGRLAELVPLVDGHLIHLRHAAAEALVGRGDPDTVLAELDRRGLVFEATSVRAALDTHPT